MPNTLIHGVRLYWELHGGAGDLLVLVHGSWGDHHNWDLVIPTFERSFRVLTYDRRGHSKSERQPGQGSVNEDAADLAALIESMNGGPAHVVGNSFGGSIVLRLAGQRPELFRSLMVHEPPLFGLLEHDAGAQEALAGLKGRIDAVMRRLAVQDYSGGAQQFVETIAFGPGAWEHLDPGLRETFVSNAPTWFDEMQDPDALTLPRESLQSFPAPSLLTMGDQSPPLFSRVVQEIAQLLPRAATRTFSSAGHVPHLTDPIEFAAAVTQFIRTSG